GSSLLSRIPGVPRRMSSLVIPCPSITANMITVRGWVRSMVDELGMRSRLSSSHRGAWPDVNDRRRILFGRYALFTFRWASRCEFNAGKSWALRAFAYHRIAAHARGRTRPGISRHPSVTRHTIDHEPQPPPPHPIRDHRILSAGHHARGGAYALRGRHGP